MSRRDAHRRALQRRAAAENDLGRFGLRLQDEAASVGVILTDLGLSHLSFFAVREINAFCGGHVGVDVAIFILQDRRPWTSPACPILDPRLLAGWRSPLIAVGTSACLEALNTPAPFVLHYVWSVDFTDRWDLTLSEIRRAFRDPRVRVVVRGEDYRRLVVSEFDARVHETVVPDFQFDELLRVVVPEAVGSHKPVAAGGERR